MSDPMPNVNTPKPQVLASIPRAYSDSHAALSAMPDMLLVGLISSCVYAGVDIALGLKVDSQGEVSVSALTLTTLIGLVWNFFITPIYIAIHRFIVLGEITPRYRLDPSDPRFMRYFGWTALLTIAGVVPSLFTLRPGAGMATNTVGLVVMLVFFVVSVRLLILFPAIAVDAPGAQWQNAFADSGGNFWRIFGIVFLTLVPLMVLGLVFTALLGDDSSLLKVIWSVVAFFSGALGVAVASRLYLVLARRLRGARPA